MSSLSITWILHYFCCLRRPILRSVVGGFDILSRRNFFHLATVVFLDVVDQDHWRDNANSPVFASGSGLYTVLNGNPVGLV